MKKSQQQLNDEYTPMLKDLYKFCGLMAYRCGQGSPELSAYLEVLMIIGTAWNRSEMTLEQAVRQPLQGQINYASGEHGIKAMFDSVRSPVPTAYKAERQHAVYVDLQRRMECNDWSLLPEVKPFVWWILINPEDEEKAERGYDQYFCALYESLCFDLREVEPGGVWHHARIRELIIQATYTREDIREECSQERIRSSILSSYQRSRVIISHVTQGYIQEILTNHFADIDFYQM